MLTQAIPQWCKNHPFCKELPTDPIFDPSKARTGYKIQYTILITRNGGSYSSSYTQYVYDNQFHDSANISDCITFEEYHSPDLSWHTKATLQLCSDGTVKLNGEDAGNGHTCSSQAFRQCEDSQCSRANFDTQCETDFGCFITCGRHDYKVSGSWERIVIS